MPKEVKINFDGSCSDYLMRNKDLACGFNMPKALKGEDFHKLPPYAKRIPFLVDEYPACPDNWMRSEGLLKSYFVPVKEDKGMWLDFNECSNHKYHVGIVISIQGINPITGLPCKDYQMEQYIDKCPKHKIKFKHNRYCEKCGYNWPKQNYISTTGTPSGQLWIDGFKAADGVVRQYILTAEKMRGVASNIIGEDRVYAIGLSFFLSKEKKSELPISLNFITNDWQCTYTYNNHTVCDTYDEIAKPYATTTDWSPDTPKTSGNYCFLDTLSTSYNSNNSVSARGINSLNNKKMIKKGVGSVLRSVKSVSTKKLEVGAGAKINQGIYDDPENLDFWNDKPESIICINYCDEKEAENIIEQGKENIKENEEGFLKNIPVGN